MGNLFIARFLCVSLASGALPIICLAGVTQKHKYYNQISSNFAHDLSDNTWISEPLPPLITRVLEITPGIFSQNMRETTLQAGLKGFHNCEFRILVPSSFHFFPCPVLRQDIFDAPGANRVPTTMLCFPVRILICRKVRPNRGSPQPWEWLFRKQSNMFVFKLRSSQ